MLTTPRTGCRLGASQGQTVALLVQDHRRSQVTMGVGENRNTKHGDGPTLCARIPDREQPPRRTALRVVRPSAAFIALLAAVAG